jgi:hypothetical protein
VISNELKSDQISREVIIHLFRVDKLITLAELGIYCVVFKVRIYKHKKPQTNDWLVGMSRSIMKEIALLNGLEEQLLRRL